MLTVVDWVLDAGALVVSLYLGKQFAGLSWRQLAVLLSCCSVYVAHEAWEGGYVGGRSHAWVETQIVDLLTTVV